jgi:hypothetical protein
MSAAGIATRGRTLQKLSILREVASARSDLLGVFDQVRTPTRGSALHATLSAAFTGSMEQDAVQLYLVRSGELLHMYAQPFDGKFALPGEHHALVEGTLGQSALLRETFSGPAWECGGDGEAAKVLNRSTALADLIEDIRWDWRVGVGRFDFPWLAQTRPYGGASTHVCMQATGEMRSTAHEVGVVQFCSLVEALMRSLWPLEQPSEQPFLQPSAFGSRFETVLRGAVVRPCDPPQTAPCDLSAPILAALAPHAGGKLLVGKLSPQKEARARASVLPSSLRHLPILAIVDLTLLGSARDAVVFTPTHGVMREGDESLVFAWPEVRAVFPPAHPDDSEVVILLSSVGEIALPCAGRAGAMAALFETFAALP